MNIHYIITTLFVLSLLNISGPAHGQDILERSEPSKPDWLADKTPAPGNRTFVYRIAEAGGSTLAKARYDCILDLAEKIKQDREIGGTIRSGGSLEQASGKESSYIEFEYESKGATQRVIYKKIDEYWEYVSYNGRAREYRCFTLYAVAVHPGETAIFDEVTFSRKYGDNMECCSKSSSKPKVCVIEVSIRCATFSSFFSRDGNTSCIIRISFISTSSIFSSATFV